ncbi:uncharacterized protein C3orf67 homolog [Xyrichtys novacula]|uniref:Uncharacterized protein C3orf67 homolog n=1 Tax=Xyrichtys novacula TaxID=13765 RepID=A0AAV1EPK2_XYRNO|nr:uncharacterized protein C3orf67 homolog [Xyrichtys novacula]
MFKNNYQDGRAVEIFSAQGKDPVAKWKLSGGPSVIHKEYDKEGKGFVYCLEGSSQTVKMQMPENGKTSLGLLQRFLVLQVNIPRLKDFSIELAITDSQHLKRRLHLSTVHKELYATPLHARIPLKGLERNIWSSLCIDLVSFSDELFKGFLSLDGITLYATCKVRRILTIKPEPSEISHDGTFLSEASYMDLITRSCHFLPGVCHVIQVLNMQSLQKADVKPELLTSDSDKSATTKAPNTRRTRPQGVSNSASASRVSGSPSHSGRKSTATSDRTEKSLHPISIAGSSVSRVKQKVSAESQSTADLSENLSHREPSSHILPEGTPGSLQPHPPKDKVSDKMGSKKLLVNSSGKEKPAKSNAVVPGGCRKRSKTRELYLPQESRRQPLTPTEKPDDPPADEGCNSSDKESLEAAPTPAESVSCTDRTTLCADLQVCSSWESHEESEPELTLQEVFTFQSQPHSPRRGRGQGEQEKREMGEKQVQSGRRRRHEALPEDDFIGSESEEDNTYTTYHLQRTAAESGPSTPRTSDAQLEVHSESHNTDQEPQKELSSPATRTQSALRGRAEPAGMVPTRCLSPSRQEQKCHPQGSEVVSQVLVGNSSVSLSQRPLQEVKLEDSTQPKEEEEEDHTMNCVNPSNHSLHLFSSLQVHGEDDDEELRMLASLKRQQEEDEFRASGLSATQIHRCNVSISMSSDNTSTWTHISTPANQGHHYQKEMNPLLQSNPREWMDVLSPPIMPHSQQRRSGSLWNNPGNLIAGGEELLNDEENEEEYLNLLYDPCLNCYFDPKTGKYYELA